MNGLLWQMQQWSRRLGIVGLLGSALLVLALGVFFSLVQPLHQQTQHQQQQFDRLHAVAKKTAVKPVLVKPDPLAMLPPDSSAAAALGELEQLADDNGFELTRGQYSVAAVNGAQLSRWQLVFQVETDYPSLHAFVAAALARLPNLVLDEVKLKRERIENVDLQAELRFSLFLGNAP